MMKNDIDSNYCRNCVRRSHYGKFNCKKCNYFYTSEYKSVSLSSRAVKMRARKESPKELVEAYDWLRNIVFPKGYVLPSKKITFRYFNQVNVLGTCWKSARTIAISTSVSGQALYETMIHEMIHLRMPHHRRKFKDKERELLAVYRQFTGYLIYK